MIILNDHREKKMEKLTIEILEEKKCTGCGACYNKCPVNAIALEYNKEGFLYPEIDASKCIHCGLCHAVCPEIDYKKTEDLIHEEGKCYAMMANDEIRMKSSSGGMFTLLAERIISQGGVVCGASYTEDYMQVEHIIVDKVEDLKRVRGSKYVQSNVGNTYMQIKSILEEKKQVLYVGCPCQIAGLYRFLDRDYENLYTVDLVCHGANSTTAYQSYVKETANGKEIKEVNFRDKTIYGWSTPTTIYFQDGSVFNAAWNESKWNDGFLKGIINRKCCSACHYAQRKRIADITLGDFWQIHRWDKNCNDWKGTSLVLLNSDKGEQIFESVRDQMKLCKEAPLDFAVQYNGQLIRPNKAHPGRKFFFNHLEKDGYHKSLWYGQKWRYDVGLVGWWFAANYGSVLTYFALGKILDDMDLLAIMIRIPKMDGTSWEPVTEENIKFMEKYFPVTKERSVEELEECNRFCDSFMVGSDQLWVQSYVGLVGYTFFLDFADENKKKLAYATSLGYSEYKGTSEEKAIAKAYLQQFDAVSVRESSGEEICRDSFNINAVRKLDPVFLCEKSHYDHLADNAKIKIQEEYILCYILDPSEKKKEAVRFLEEKMGVKAIVILDMKTFSSSKEKWGQDNVIDNVGIEDFINLIKNCKYLLSDSHHGICFGLIYHKDFICIANKSRGYTRFESLFNLLDIRDHMVDDAGEILENPKLLESIDYSRVDSILENEKKESLQWLKDALEKDKKAEDQTNSLLIKTLNRLHKLERENKKLKQNLIK